MVRIYDLRRQHRQDLLFEILLDVLLLLLFQLFEIHPAHSVRLQLLLDLRIRLVTLLIQRRDRLVDRLQLLLRGHARLRVKLLVIHCRHVIEAAHADHKELIQVACKDRDEFHPFH